MSASIPVAAIQAPVILSQMHKAIAIPAGEREKTAGMTSASLTGTEKREALEEVLQSERFFRAEQLRNFLRYICEMEIAGRGSELCESLIGIQALGRPANYTPTEDASVRRRASDLREKLQEVYATELASSKVRIELPKGKYIPRFVRVEHESVTNGAPAPLLPAKSASVEAASREHAHEPVETALSRLPDTNVIATRIDPGDMEPLRGELTTASRHRLPVFWLAVGWVLGAIMVSTGFLAFLWLRPSRTESASRVSVPAQAASYPIADSVATEPGTSYEAEASGNTFNQMARTWPCYWCSGGARVRYIGRSPRNYLVMNHVNVAQTGNYEMVVFYLVDGTRTLFIKVNDGPPTSLLLSSKSWREVARTSITVPLRAGSNRVKFYNDSGYAPDIDRIIIR